MTTMQMEFKDLLFSAMCELNLNQRQVCGMTGCSKASVSQYLSGKNVPSMQKQAEIAEDLGLDPDYFKEGQMSVDQTQGKMRKMLPEEAARILGVGKETIRNGLQQGVFPWGYAVKMDSGKWTYIINAARLYEIEGIQP